MAEKRAKEADEARARALRQREKAEAAERKAKQQEQDALLAKQEAEEQRQLAEEQRKEAQKSERAAKTQEKFAKDAERKARLNAEETEKLRYLSVAKSLAIKSTHTSDTTDKVLLAQHAYSFNGRYEGNIIEPDIYLGLWKALETLSNQPLNTLNLHHSSVKNVEFFASKEKNILYSASSEGLILATDWNTKETREVYNCKYPINDMKVVNNGKFIVFSDDRADLIVIDIAEGKQLKSLNSNYTNSIWYIEEGNGKIYTSGEEKLVYEWDLNTNEHKKLCDMNSIPRSLDYKASENILYIGTQNGELIAYDISTQKKREIYTTSGNIPITSIAVNPNKPHICIGMLDGKINIWDYDNQENLITLEGNRALISDLKYSNDGTFLASSSFDNSIYVWDMENYNNPPLILGNKGDGIWVQAITFDVEDEHLLAGFKDNTITYYPMGMTPLSDSLCNKINGKGIVHILETKKWNRYVGSDIPSEKACE